MVYPTKTAMNTYKGPRRFSLHLLYLSTPRPEGSKGGVVVGIHSQVVLGLHRPLRINIKLWTA
jgi:hypothetical protein